MRLLALVVGVGFASAAASEAEVITKPELIDDWGSVIYCQAIYEEPDVRGRIYPGDHEACGRAYDLMVYRVKSSYTPREGQEIAQNAARRATAIRHNTRSVQEAIAACRHQCRAFSEKLDENTNTTKKSADPD